MKVDSFNYKSGAVGYVITLAQALAGPHHVAQGAALGHEQRAEEQRRQLVAAHVHHCVIDLQVLNNRHTVKYVIPTTRMAGN